MKRTNQLGNAAIEFAAGIGLLAILFTGTFKFAWSIYQYNRLQTLVSNASVLASRLDFDVDYPNSYTSTIKNMVVYGSPVAGTTAALPGLSAANVNVNINPSGGMPTDVTITVQNFDIDAVFYKLHLVNKPRVTTVYMGHVTCTTCTCSYC